MSAFDGNEEAQDILEDGDFVAVVLVTIDRNDSVSLFTRWRDPNSSTVSANIISRISRTLTGIDVVNKYPL
jgi:hypothetical protein